GLSLVAEVDGRIAGAVFGNDFATSAYVSLMGVDPALHRRGVGTALMAELMAWCDERGFADVRLDATPAGAPLYERFGFVDAGETVVLERERFGAWSGNLGAALVRAARDGDLAAILALDRRVFGADRSAMLEPLLAQYPALIATDQRGYVVMQRSDVRAMVGPWVAPDAGTARALLAAALDGLGRVPTKLFVPGGNAYALALAAKAGFVAQRALRHMIRGACSLPSAALFGRANLGQG
ncbi:MAG: GNAT family N-acetyltransferase, partial [Candidatus Eremiobacteraeota bacterium]|nr:GNAT family N-acetyltransferase [Candidatus Eremiobacteraeota bacterium]